jgi:hypothetical protein
MKHQKAWNAAEVSTIYHLVSYGYTNDEIKKICIDNTLYPDRTESAIHGKVSDVRKWISKSRGFVVSNYDLSANTEKVFKRAIVIPELGIISMQKPNPPREFKRSHVKAEKINSPVNKLINNIPDEQDNAIQKPPFTREATPAQIIPITEVATDKLPAANIIDVMRMAKELGALEVEYSGVKIKF